MAAIVIPRPRVVLLLDHCCSSDHFWGLRCIRGPSQVDIIPQAGHYPFLDQPLLFLEKVLSQTLKAFPSWQPPQQQHAEKEVPTAHPRV